MSRAHRCLFTVATLCFVLASAQRNVTVEEDNSRLVYSPPFESWDRFTNPITLNETVYNNYFHGGAYVAIHEDGASVSFVFNGSYIAYYGDEMNNHGRLRVELDGEMVLERSTFSVTPKPQSLIYETDVDPNVPNHKITLTCLENDLNMPFDYFLYTEATPTPAAPSSTSTSTPSISSTSTPSISSTSPATDGSSGSTVTNGVPSSAVVFKENTTPTIIAAVFAGLGWAVAFVFGALLCLKRRKPSAPPPPAVRSSAVVDMEQAAETGTISAFASDQPSVISSAPGPSYAVPAAAPMRTKRQMFSGKPPSVLSLPSESSPPDSSNAASRAGEASVHVSPPAYSDRD